MVFEILRSKVMIADLPTLCLVAATLALGGAEAAGACERGRSWWDRARQACAPCTRCEPQRAVRLPCELHRDTVCQLVEQIQIGYELTDYEYYEVSDEVSDSDGNGDGDGGVKWDLQISTLTLAASGCVVFFAVVIYFSIYYSKQWKALKQALRIDVQEFSAKLKLMEAGEAPAEPVVPTDHHIYCNIHVAKDSLLDPTSNKGLGNVYTQEKHAF